MVFALSFLAMLRVDEALAAPRLDCDYNLDGICDAADYSAWRKSPVDFQGDPQGYDLWREGFDESAFGAAPGAVATPEPSGALLALIGAFVAYALSGRRSRTSSG